MATQMNTRTLKTSDVKVYAASDLSYTTQIGEIKVVNKVAPLDTDKLSIESDHDINITTSGDTDIKINSVDGKVKVQAGTDVNIQANEEINITGSNDLNMFGGYVTLTATEGTTAIASADNVTISAGSSSVNKEINLNANAVKVNGKSIEPAINQVANIFPSGNLGINVNIAAPGLYLVSLAADRGKFTPMPNESDTILLIVTEESGTTSSDVDWKDVCQLAILMGNGTIYKRRVSYSGPNLDVLNWNTAPDFTEV
jgi:hypothetical protein